MVKVIDSSTASTINVVDSDLANARVKRDDGRWTSSTVPSDLKGTGERFRN
jgi:hypothetical protein